MAIHTFAYTSSVGSVTNSQINAITDNIFLTQNNHVVPPKDCYLLAAAAIGSTLTTCRFYSPTIRQVGLSHIRPIMQSSAPSTVPQLATYCNDPLLLRGLEEIQVDVSDTSGSSDQVYAVFIVSDGIRPVPQGPVIRIRLTGTTTMVSNTWSSCGLTADDILPAGQYELLNLTFISTGAIVARAIVDNQLFRPGTLGVPSLAFAEHVSFSNRWFGSMGQFRNTSLPRVEAVSKSNDTTQTVFMDIVKTGA